MRDIEAACTEFEISTVNNNGDESKSNHQYLARAIMKADAAKETSSTYENTPKNRILKPSGSIWKTYPPGKRKLTVYNGHLLSESSSEDQPKSKAKVRLAFQSENNENQLIVNKDGTRKIYGGAKSFYGLDAKNDLLKKPLRQRPCSVNKWIKNSPPSQNGSSSVLPPSPLTNSVPSSPNGSSSPRLATTPTSPNLPPSPLSSDSPPPKLSASKLPLPSKLRPHKVGFPNLHQTCYLNAIIQCLLSQPSLVKDLLEFDMMSDGSASSELVESFRTLALFKEDRGSQLEASDEILKLKNILANSHSDFRGDHMQDADEFLLKFCDTLKEQCKIHLSEGQCDPVSSNIEYLKEETLKCDTCSYQTVKTYQELICHLAQPKADVTMSVGSLLEKSFQNVKLTCWRCEKCNGSSASLSVRFKKIPRVLILYLPRSDYDPSRPIKSRKIQSLVKIPQYINLTAVAAPDISIPPNTRMFTANGEWDDEDEEEDFFKPLNEFPETPEKFRNLSEEQIGKLNEEDSMALAIRHSLKESNQMTEEDQIQAAITQSLSSDTSDEGQEDPPLPMEEDESSLNGVGINSISTYKLASVVSHLGVSVSSGHYIADVFRFDKQGWYRYNDMRVFKRETDLVCGDENMRNGYLFFYTYSELFTNGV